MTERKTDDFIFGLLRKAGIKYTPDGSDIKEVAEALATASKAKTKRVGRPEFTALVGDYLIVGENKKSINQQGLYLDGEKTQLDESVEATRNFAENGALHYAKHIAVNTPPRGRSLPSAVRAVKSITEYVLYLSMRPATISS